VPGRVVAEEEFASAGEDKGKAVQIGAERGRGVRRTRRRGRRRTAIRRSA
jgi:hypothetical protein